MKEDVKPRFRHFWVLGMPAVRDTKNYFNLLVESVLQENDNKSIHDVLKIIIAENADLPGISWSKLVSNLNDNYKRQYLVRF